MIETDQQRFQQNNNFHPGNFNALDIGTGTGLLSLMLAQETNALIDAVEIEPMAAKQAAENFFASPFQQQLQIVEADIKQWTAQKTYDLIFSNPPFSRM